MKCMCLQAEEVSALNAEQSKKPWCAPEVCVLSTQVFINWVYLKWSPPYTKSVIWKDLGKALAALAEKVTAFQMSGLSVGSGHRNSFYPEGSSTVPCPPGLGSPLDVFSPWSAQNMRLKGCGLT